MSDKPNYGYEIRELARFSRCDEPSDQQLDAEITRMAEQFDLDATTVRSDMEERAAIDEQELEYDRRDLDFIDPTISA